MACCALRCKEKLSMTVYESKKNNYLVKLFKGDVPLVITYWIFGVLIGGVLVRGGYAILEYNYASLAISEAGIWFFRVISWLIIVYSVFILIAIWRSAGKYNGNSAWSILARTVVIINIITFSVNIWLGSDTDYMVGLEADMMNKGLPVMVDNETRLDSVKIQKKDLYFNYTLVNWIKSDIDLEQLNSTMREKIKMNACETSDTRSLLEEGRSLFYVYKDKESTPVAEFMVILNDCTTIGDRARF